MNWLQNIKPPKYLRYLFFIAYSKYRKFTSERSTAHGYCYFIFSIYAYASL